MDSPEYNLKDVVRCNLCETPVPYMYCDTCQMNLCKPCLGEHLSDESKEHTVVSFKRLRSTPKCPKHSFKPCILHCEKCDIPICLQCVSSGEHEQHKKVEFSTNAERKKKVMQNDLQELENIIHPKYEKFLSNVTVQRSRLLKNSTKLKNILDKQERDWHNELHTIITNLKAEADKLEFSGLECLDDHECKIRHIIAEIKQSIVDIRTLIEHNDDYTVYGYISRNAEFSKLPDRAIVPSPSIYPYYIDKEPIYEHYRSLLNDGIKTTLGGYSIDSHCDEPTPTSQLLMIEPHVVSYVRAEIKLCNVSCLNKEELWTSGDDDIMRLYNIYGDLVTSIQTKSGNTPKYITVTRNGDLVYTDFKDRTVNIVRDTEIQTLIRLEGWVPHGVCSTSTDELLVLMDCDDDQQAKVVRYSGSTEKQSIQFDKHGLPLYSLCFLGFYITENKNQDICVSDLVVNAVVVVNKAGEFRFRYTGPSRSTDYIEGFSPRGITTDSLCRILISDSDNSRIHIIDQDGEFLRYIDNCRLQRPIGVCVDSEDTLFVADERARAMKRIQYYMTRKSC